MSLFNEPRLPDHPKPVVEIAVDGISLNSLLRQRLINLTHIDNRGFEADTVEIALDDSDNALDLPAKGAELNIAFGWAAGIVVDKGKFTVTGISHNGAPDVLTIRASAADLRTGLTTQRERSWHATTVGAIVRTLADENGLTPVIPDSLAGIAIDHIDQTNESAVNLLTRLAGQHDAVATVKNGRLLFIHAAGGKSASGKDLPAVIIRRQSGDRHQFTIEDRDTYSGVKALYHDTNLAVKGEVIWGDTEDSAERNVKTAPAAAAPTGQYKQLPGNFTSRDKALRAARKAWKATRANKTQRAAYIGVKANYNDRNLEAAGTVHYGQADDDKKKKSAQRLAARDIDSVSTNNAFTRSADNVKTLRHVYSSKANATRAARTEWRRLQRGMATFSITLAQGQPELFPEVPAIVTGWKPQIDNTDWLVIRVTNNINDGGYTQTVEFEIKATEIPD